MHKPEITIRPIHITEAEPLLRLRLEALQDTPEAFGEDFAYVAAQPFTAWQDQIAHSLGDGDRAIFVASPSVGVADDRLDNTWDAQFIGMAGVNRSTMRNMRHSASVWGVYVQPAWRSQGFATALVRACCNWGRAQQGLIALRLAVITDNPAAICVYEKCGFRTSGVDPKAFYVNGKYYDLARMTLLLAD